ncbi:MAG: nuclear transport factor 2 family protein [Flammeovirgaceae bacterium]
MKYLSVLVLCAAFAACSTSTPNNENEKLVREMFAAFNRHEWKAMTEFYADTAEFLDPSYGTKYVKKSRSETEAKYAEMQNTFLNIHDEVMTLFAKGDQVAVEFISTGTANGEKFELPISSVLTIANGKIVKDATYYNNCQE